ncbi:MAG TPA: DUF3159 domain-containing protein [Acidimicrobiia bacterium]|nr:DUF3159 domain-containing protein [Acidimicrobiia bacterium]
MRREVGAELRNLVSGRVGIADGVLPPILFVLVNAVWGLTPAAMAGLGAALAITLFRLARGRPVRFAIAGLAGTAIAVVFAIRSESAESYFLPGIISGVLTTAVLIVSVPLKRPAVAFTSWITRGWPLEWYWHPKIRPAYARATLIWAVFFGVRTAVQWRLFLDGEVEWLGLVRVGLGWPALLILLIGTYLLGRRWLIDLGGPSVEEFRQGSPAPWSGQRTGF